MKVYSSVFQVISSLLDSDPISVEEQIKAMREMLLNVYRLHNDAGFELVTQLDLPQRPEFSREKPLTDDVWKWHKSVLLNADGSFKDMHSLKVLIFRGGLTPSLRKEAWKYLLGIYDCNKSAADNNAVCFFFCLYIVFSFAI
uniref:Rab-GAP TBC domain-containing protein n=1 Tax=Parascaris equorum TaxID=6256 RepID=A0A914RFJ1_PAREQ